MNISYGLKGVVNSIPNIGIQSTATRLRCLATLKIEQTNLLMATCVLKPPSRCSDAFLKFAAVSIRLRRVTLEAAAGA